MSYTINPNSDYAELEIAHEEQSVDETADAEYSNEIFSGSLKSRAFREKIKNSRVSKTAVTPFLASVQIDLERRRPIGLLDLFNAWLDLGNKYWLNPMDKENGIGVLEEILLKFQGDENILSPFILLLTQAAKNGISPRSFTEYVILPRMYQDNNWRKWRENHLEALQIIVNLIYSIKDRPPFTKEHLGSGKIRLARDVVLVRYIGRPLAQFQLTQLRDSTMLDDYISAWLKISLQDPLSLYFMRNNALHFFYVMSGKIDLVQLIAIIDQLPEIEKSFNAAFPDGITKLESIQSMNLYDYDIENALLTRKQHGFHNLDFIVEIKAYFNIVKALLEKPTGVYLCAYYARLLKRYKDPVMADIISRLVRIIDDRGGMHIYKWHTKRLLAKTKDGMQSYLGYIEENNGCDPEYPDINLVFRDEEFEHQLWELENLYAEFNFEFSSGRKTDIDRNLLKLYIQENPESEQIIYNYQQQFLSGHDRQWTDEYIQQLDMLCSHDKNLNILLLGSVIRGMSLIEGQKCFHDSFKKYGSVQSSKKINIRTSFVMPVIHKYRNSADQDKIARKSVNLAPMEKLWNSMCSPEPVNVDNILPYINKWTIELNEPLEKAFNEKVFMETLLKQAIEDEIRIKTEKDILKQDKTIAALQEKKQNFTAIMEEYNTLNDVQKFILALILAGTAGRTDAEFTGYAAGLLLRRYKELASISSRWNFLREDISIDVISYQQLEYLLNFLETLFFVLGKDKVIVDLLINDIVLQRILKPFLITKTRLISPEALDAAAKKITGYASMQAERAKWQDILEKMEKKDGKYFHKMEIYTSKTFMDSYYGDMGGICLSAYPQLILLPGFFVQRLADITEGEIIGMSILYLSNGGFGSPQVSSQNFWQVFAFNPLSSVLKHYSEEQQLYLYLQFRLNMEKVAWATKLPVVLSGIDTDGGLISNNGLFCSLIRRYKCSKPTAKNVFNARGISIYYNELEFKVALVIIDPRGFEQVTDPAQVPTFYAYRELGAGNNLNRS